MNKHGKVKVHKIKLHIYDEICFCADSKPKLYGLIFIGTVRMSYIGKKKKNKHECEMWNEMCF